MADSVSLFQGATGMIIGSQINVQTVHTGRKDLSPGAQLQLQYKLLKHCCIGAQLDSNERFDPPKCDPSTRIAITEEIMQWVANEDEPASAIILHGSAGVSKSALGQSLAERCQREGRLASTFFLSRNASNSQRSDGNTVIPTLVYQLIQNLPWLKAKVLKEIEEDLGIFERSRAALMDRLFVKHFRSNTIPLSTEVANVRFIVIDGLDECNDPDTQCDLLRIIACAIPLFAYPFRFLIACRPESHLMAVINRDPSFQTDHIRRIDLGEDPHSEHDIRTFLVNEFKKIQETHLLGKYLPVDWPSDGDLSALIRNASGQFIYVDTVVRFIRLRRYKPDDQLKIILGLSPPPIKEKPFARLDALYQHILSCVKDLSTVWRILGILRLCAKNYLGRYGAGFTSPSYLEMLLMSRPGEIEFGLEDLASVIRVTSRNTPVKVMHASLFDFLLDPARAGDFALDLSLAHETLAEYSLSRIKFESFNFFIGACGLFFCHCQYANLSSNILAEIVKVVSFLINPCNFRKGLRLSPTPDLYDERLRAIAHIFGWNKYSHETPSLNLVNSITALWHDVDCFSIDLTLDNISERHDQYSAWFKDTFGPIVDALCFIGDKNLVAIQSTKGHAKSTHTRVIEMAQELVGNGQHGPPRVQGAISGTRLLFWIHRMQCDFQMLLVRSPERLLHWIVLALKQLPEEPQNSFEPSDAAIVWFAATLLSHCDCDRIRSASQFCHILQLVKRYSHRQLLGETPPQGLVDFSKIQGHYREEFKAFHERVRTHPVFGHLFAFLE